MKKVSLFIYITICLTLSGQELKKDNFVIEWGRFQEINLSEGNRFLVSTIPSYIYNNFPKELEHFPNSHESKEIHKHLLKVEQSTVKKELYKLLETRDEFLFNQNTTDSVKEENRKSIITKNKELEKLNTLDLSRLKYIVSLPITFKPEQGGELSHIDIKNNPNYLKNNNVDYYISGTIEEIESEIFVKIILYSKYLTEVMVLWSGVGSSEEILSYKDDMLNAVIFNLTSNSMIRYDIDVSPEDALIYIDGEFKALGLYTGYGLVSDKIEIDVKKEGFKNREIIEILDEGNREFKIELSEDITEYINVDTEPTGAMVYYGSRYIGVTPVNIPKFSYPLRLTLSLDGFLDHNILIDENSNDINFNFSKTFIDTEEYLKKEKEKFYISTAIFSISLALPLFLDAQNDILTSDYRTTLINITAGNAIIWGLNLFYRLYRYLEAAKLSVN